MYTCNIVIWSAIGHTPITGRNGGYCDELKKFSIAVNDHEEAAQNVRDAIRDIEHAKKGHYLILNYWNHNKANDFIS